MNASPYNEPQAVGAKVGLSGRPSVVHCVCAQMLVVALVCIEASGQIIVDCTGTGEDQVCLEANRVAREVTEGLEIVRLSGGVHLESRETRIWAKNAVSYGDSVHFVGEVTIVDASDTLTAHEVVYERDAKRGFASGDVRLSDGQVVLTAPVTLYDAEEKTADFVRGVRLVDSISVLVSEKGKYWTEEKRARFFGNVVLEQDDLSLWSDSLEHFRETAVSDATGNVNAVQRDRTDSRQLWTYLAGDRVRHERDNRQTHASGEPVMLRVENDAGGSDTLVVRSAHLTGTSEEGRESILAWGGVEIWQSGLASVADSVVFIRLEDFTAPAQISGVGADASTTERGTVRWFGDPVIWMNETQITGDTVKVGNRGGRPDSLHVVGAAFIARPDTLSGRIQQVRGRSLTGKFERDTLRTVRVGPNAEAIYFRSDEESGRLKDAVTMSADEIRLVFQNGAVASVRAFGGIEGEYYEPEAIPDAFELGGFRWAADRRPGRGLLVHALERLRHVFPTDDPESESTGIGTLPEKD